MCASLHNFIIIELHAGGLASHIGRDKPLGLIEERFYLPNLHKEVTKFVE